MEFLSYASDGNSLELMILCKKESIETTGWEWKHQWGDQTGYKLLKYLKAA